MKKKLSFFAFALLSAAMAVCSCSDFDTINTDPDNPTALDPDLLIPTIQFYTGAEWQEQNRYFIYPAGFMNQWAGNYTIVYHGGCGRKHSNYHERLWATYYPEGMKNTADIIARTKSDTTMVNICSMARVLRVHFAQKLTDFYGDVPYSEAGQGYYENNLKPRYDTQQDIYHDMLKELKEASAAFDKTKYLSQHDLMFGGDVGKWRKYANSLRLRVAMRLVKVEPELAKAEAEDAIKAGIMSIADENAQVFYENIRNSSSGKGKGNAVANFLFGNNDTLGSEVWITSEFIKELEDTSDPRLLLCGEVFLNDKNRTDITDLVRAKRSCYAAMCTQAQRYSYSQNTDYPSDNSALSLSIGGKTQDLALRDTRMRPSHYITAFDSPFIYMSAAEAQFLACEAAARGWDVPEAADQYYVNAVKAAMDQWKFFGATISQSKVISYLSANPYSATNALRQINTQLWILHLLDPLETWANWRRSGYPTLIFHNYEAADNQSNGTFPRRMVYPLEEQLKNRTSYDEAVARMGGKDDWTTRVWWDKE